MKFAKGVAYNRELAAPVFKLSEFDLPNAILCTQPPLCAITRNDPREVKCCCLLFDNAKSIGKLLDGPRKVEDRIDRTDMLLLQFSCRLNYADQVLRDLR